MGEYKSETERAAELQGKALSIRDYMQEPDTMKQLVAALPKWLNAERFTRLFYTAMMQTEKLLECTKQSLLSCMIQAAQIAIEPVFGKAALIPYGKEVQLQLMYKGLMEVARRFADIVITGHVVYEVDEFDIEWGDNEKLHHKPRFGPDREESKKIGAYDIWKVGDVIRSRRFMPTSDILFIRDTYSKAWNKDGKKSVWGKHEDDMFLKTVIKGHCKLEPQCIEMERAVGLDDRIDMGKSQLGMGSLQGLPMPTVFDFGGIKPEETPGEPGPDKEKGKPRPPADVAKAMAAQSGLPAADIKEFITFIAKKQEKTEKWVEENAVKSPDSFIKAVRNRLQSLKKQGEKEKAEAEERAKGEGKEKGETGSVDAAHMKEFWNLRVGKGGKTGLKAYVSQHIDRIYNVYSENVRTKLIEKFKSFYPGEIFPAAFKKPETPPAEETRPPITPETTGATGAGGAGGADDKPPFKNPLKSQGDDEAFVDFVEGAVEKVLTSTEETEAKREEMDLVARYNNSVESIMKFDKSGVKYTLDDFEKFMMEMAHMEGITFNSFKADVMRRHQFPDYFDKFIARISGREG